MKKSILAFLALTLISAQSFAGNNGEGKVITLLKPLSISSGVAISSEGRNLEYIDIDKNLCYLNGYSKQDAELIAGSKLIISEVKSDIVRTENLHALAILTVKMSPQGDNSIILDLTCQVEGFSKVAVSKKLIDLNKAVKAYGTILKLE